MSTDTVQLKEHRMNVHSILLIAAFVCFVASTLGWGRGVSIGLACWVLTLII
jgi:hypothetical protein